MLLNLQRILNMIKYITLSMVVFLIVGCGAKATSTNINTNIKQTVTQKVKSTVKVKREPRRMTLPESFKEIKKLRPLEGNIPKTCQEWSDGCNRCTRAGENQASCTVYSCENKVAFSCLKWQ